MQTNLNRNSFIQTSCVLSNCRIKDDSYDTTHNMITTVLWSQTTHSISLEINAKNIDIMVSNKYLVLTFKDQKITLPLFGTVYINQTDLNQINKMNQKIGLNHRDCFYITLEKQSGIVWPHLLMHRSDQDVTQFLSEARFFMRIHQLPISLYHTLDFNSIMDCQGEKTGLE